ncbi:serine hydrolase domain-containing protein [Glycomyces salinus]|uniref:serine hydrolase domain-containing protein n=1 Tax=Glycomyces salinus TaxID=980294 RepID=UPI0018ED79B5|nr:serine hydrolase domain-containing protein [Glycomyces salinus]
MRRIPTILAAALLAAACTADADTPDEPEAAPVCDPGLVSALSAWAEAGYSGSIALTDEAGLACATGFGAADAESGEPNTAATVFAIGSVSKAFTAAAIFDLADAGTLALDDRAGDLLPGLEGPAAAVTVEQLLLHTGGLAGSHGADHEPLDRDEAVEALSGLESAFDPGTDYLYSNSGYTLLALIVDEQSGKAYRGYLAEEILPLSGGFWDGEPAAPGPRAIGYEGGERAASTGDFEGPHWALAGNGDLAMTAGDLASWTSALFEGEIISPEATALLTETGFDHGDGSTELPGWVALDAAGFGTPVYASTGGGGDTGHQAVTAWLPESGRSITVTSNTDEITAEELLEAVGPALASGEPLPVPETQEADPAELRAAEGAYTLETGGTLAVAAEASALAVSAEGADAVEALFEPTGDVVDHEAAVESLLNGETEAGREELEVLEDDLGPIEEIELAGTVFEESELRTYVRLTTGGETRLAWYALDEHGQIAGVLLGAEPPVFKLVPADDGEFRQQDLSGAGRGVRVRFEDGLMTVTGPGGTVEARRAD